MNNKFKKALFLSLFIIIPFLINPFNGDVELIKVLFICVYTCLLLIFAVLFIKDEFKLNINSKILTYSLIGFLILALISSFQNDFFTSLIGSYERNLGFVVWLSCALIALVTPYFIKDNKILIKLVKIFIWIGFFSAIAAYSLSLMEVNTVFEGGRLSGTTGNPNILGKLLLFSLVINLLFLVFIKEKNRFLYIMTLLGQLFVFVLTGNRASWFALGVICLILVFQNPKKYFKYASLLIVGSIPFAVFIFQRLIDTVSINTRLEIYKNALTALFNRGIFGYGFDFSHAILTPGTYSHSVDRAHQLFLDIGLTVGIPGLIFFMVFTIVSIYQLIKAENQYYKIFGYALLGLIISLQFSYFSSITLLLFFLCIGLNLQRSLKKLPAN